MFKESPTIEPYDPHKASPAMNLVTFGIGTCIFLLLLYLLIDIETDKSGFMRLGLLMLMQLTPAIIIFTRRQFNYLAFVLVNHFIAYSVAKFNLLSNIEKVGTVPQSALSAIQEMTYCTFLIVLSYYFCRYFLFKRIARKHQFHMFHLTREQFTWVSIYVLAQPLLFSYLPISLRAINAACSGMAVILVFCSETGHEVLERWVKSGIFMVALVSFLNQGSLAFFVGVSSVFFIVCFIQWRTQNFILVFMLLTAGIVIQTVKGSYRLILRSQTMNLFESAQVLGTLIAVKYAGYVPETEGVIMEAVAEDEEEISDSLAKGFGRVGDDSLERVLAYTPSRVPYWNGETYAHIPFIFIPRFIWPDKPKRDMWNKFGRLYEFLSEEDEATSVGVNFLGEAYMNFGFFGLYSVSIFFGIMISLMETLSYFLLRKYTFFTFIAFLTPFMTYGLDLGSILNAIVIVVSVLLVLRYRIVPLVQHDAYA